MKTPHLILLTATAAIASCAPNSPNSADQPTLSPASASAEVPAPTINDNSHIPVGRPSPTGKANMIISPYKPYNLIDVKGYKSGEVVGDPSTASLDEEGKPVLSTSKSFRLP